MKLEDVKINSLDLGYEIPAPGISLCQLEEGIEKKTNEKSGKSTLRLPLTIIRVLEGEQENEGKKLSHFVPIETAFGEKQLAAILAMTGLVPTIVKACGKEFEAGDEKFLNLLKLKLPGRTLRVHHNIRQDNKGRDQVNVTRFEPADSKGDEEKPAALGKPQAKQQAAPTPPAAPVEESWG